MTQRAHAHPDPPVQMTREAPARVLVVDDDVAVLDVTCRILGRAGYEVLRAEGGEEALDIVGQEERPIQLLLTDVVMPGISGPDLAERLRAVRPDLPVLYMSGYTGNQSILEEGRVARAGDFIPKPFTLHGLVGAVEEILSS